MKTNAFFDVRFSGAMFKHVPFLGQFCLDVGEEGRRGEGGGDVGGRQEEMAARMPAAAPLY